MDSQHVLALLKDAFDNANTVHYMSEVFSHLQTWATRDGELAYVRFQMQPWYRDLEVHLAELMMPMERSQLEGQPAPRGPRMNKLLDAMKVGKADCR